MRVESTPPTSGFEWDAARLREAVAAANRLAPEFVVMGGDMVDDAADDAQYGAVRSIAAHLEVPMHWAPGNHDVAWDARTPTEDSLAAYRARFGPNRYAFTHRGVGFVVLDTTLWGRPEQLEREAALQEAWLERTLGELRTGGAGHILAFGHHPPFLESATEDDTYWTVPTEHRRALLDLLTGHEVRAMFCGHWHRNGGATDEGLEVAVTGPVGYPLGADPSGFRIVDVTADDVTHQYVSLEEV
jgi:3',5'-cyclic AMP phosphodiesterase CpdA